MPRHHYSTETADFDQSTVVRKTNSRLASTLMRVKIFQKFRQVIVFFFGRKFCKHRRQMLICGMKPDEQQQQQQPAASSLVAS
jgi:hypothetical protein